MKRFNEIWLLLDIIHKATIVGPAAGWCSDEALKMLADLKATPQIAEDPELPLEPQGDDHA
jgi:hypothetical protein